MECGVRKPNVAIKMRVSQWSACVLAVLAQVGCSPSCPTLGDRMKPQMAITLAATLICWQKKPDNYLASIKVACILLWYRKCYQLEVLR